MGNASSLEKLVKLNLLLLMLKAPGEATALLLGKLWTVRTSQSTQQLGTSATIYALDNVCDTLDGFQKITLRCPKQGLT